MLIGHKPVCAFWRFSGDGEWITNTSQGGTMSYENVPMNALELAVKASKAAKAEYWACDIAIDKNDDKPYILECATAFAAFPYIRDWICEYLMWDFSNGKYKMPYVPLYSWVELGKIDPSLLRTMRHIGFSKYTPSCDGAYFINEKDSSFDMEKTILNDPSDYPEEYSYEKLPAYVQLEDIQTENSNDLELTKINFNTATLTDIMTLHGMEEELALDIQEFIAENIITDPSDLLDLESIDEQMIKTWDNNIADMRIDINNTDQDTLKKIKGIGAKLAKIILDFKEEIEHFTDLDQLKEIEGIGKNKLAQLKSRLKIGE